MRADALSELRTVIADQKGDAVQKLYDSLSRFAL